MDVGYDIEGIALQGCEIEGDISIKSLVMYYVNSEFINSYIDY